MFYRGWPALANHIWDRNHVVSSTTKTPQIYTTRKKHHKHHKTPQKMRNSHVVEAKFSKSSIFHMFGCLPVSSTVCLRDDSMQWMMVVNDVTIVIFRQPTSAKVNPNHDIPYRRRLWDHSWRPGLRDSAKVKHTPSNLRSKFFERQWRLRSSNFPAKIQNWWRHPSLDQSKEG